MNTNKNATNNMKQTNISQFFKSASTVAPQPSKDLFDSDSFFDDITSEEIESSMTQPPPPSSQSSQSSQSSSNSGSAPSTPSKLKLPQSYHDSFKTNNTTTTTTSTNKTPTKPLQPTLPTKPAPITATPKSTNNTINSHFSKVDDNSTNKSNDLFARFKEEDNNKPLTSSVSSPAKNNNNNTSNNTTTTPNKRSNLRKRKEIDIIDEDDEDGANNENDSKSADSANSMDLDVYGFSFSNNKQRATTPTPTTPTRARKPIVTIEESDDDENDDEEGDDDDSQKTNKKEKGKPFGKKMDKKELEQRYSFLVEPIKDAAGNPRGSPDYDPRTLHIPATNLAKFSPFERQFWDIKAKHYDTVVFFKKGKFYELYENDADIGHQILHLKMTDRINMRMVGVPESAFTHWASKLINLGYKVAKVDQMETSIGMNKRQNEKGGRNKKDSIIQRELTSILTAGTLLDEGMIADKTSTYLMAIKEDEFTKKYGVCFVDVSIGEFFLCSIEDDDNRMQFETLLLQMMPKEVVYEKNAVSAKTMSIMKRVLATVRPVMNGRSSLEYWDPSETLRCIREANGGEKIPESLKEMKSDTFLICALGGCLSYLFDIKIGEQVIEQGRYKHFNPLDVGNSLILDGQCLVNLEIFNNSTDGTTEGTLFKLMDRCNTSFGKRLFRQWICRPLANIELIRDRQQAIEHLRDNPDHVQKVDSILKKLPDLERMLARIRAGSSKIQDLISVINHFESIHSKLEEFEKIDEIESTCLRSCLMIENVGGAKNDGDEEMEDLDKQEANGNYEGYPNLLSYLSKIRDSFKVENDRIIPSPGLFEEFDESQKKIQQIEQSLEDHLNEQRKYFNCKAIEFKHMGKEIYQIEVPVSALNRAKLPNSFELKSKTKAANRYHTPFIIKTLPSLLEERDQFDVLSRDVSKKIQANFSVYFNHFSKAVQKLARLDCLYSLYKVSFQSGIQMCRPIFISKSKLSTDNNGGILDVRDMRHPCIYSKAGDDFIPNDLSLNVEKSPPSVLVLTGPNMGGKSTLLRQACILVIMAQMGCYVSASSCEMTIVDRIFTRLGANDNILAGQSTFMVELQETCSVLKYATSRSLVILDELGRGTSTFDGYSIAFSVLSYITKQLKSLCIFATHYQSLAMEPSIRDQISTGYMTCQVDDQEKKVIFLYKLATGICEKSYGLHVAAMAGLPKEIVNKAEEKSIEMERESVLVSYIHGTIHRSEMVKKIISSFKKKDVDDLTLLANTLKNINLLSLSTTSTTSTPTNN